MRVLVTGGTGFIGTALCRRLLAAGHEVGVLSRDRNRAERHFHGRVRATQSLTDDSDLGAPDVIVNLAGANIGRGRWNRKRKRELVSSRIETTEHVVRYIERTSPRPSLLISGSAVGYYGARGDEALTEQSRPGDEFQSDLCQQWERAAMAAMNHGTRICISRTGVVMGPGGGALSGLVPQFCRGMGAYAGSGRQWISWIHLEDLLDLLQRFMDQPQLQGAFNNTAPEPITNRAFAQTLGRMLGKPVRGPVPGPVLRLLMGEMAHLYLTGQRVLPQRHLDAGVRWRFPTLELALANLLDHRACR